MWSYQIVPRLFSMFLVLCMMACTLYEFYSEKEQVVFDRLMFHPTDTFKILSRLAYLLFYVFQPNISLSIFKTSTTLSRASRYRLAVNVASTLCGWDFRERKSKDEYGQHLPREMYPHLISVIELALDMILPSILPAAFKLYDLSRYGPSKIMLGTYSPPTAFESLHSNYNLWFPASNRQTNSTLVICYVGFSAVAKFTAFIATFIAWDLDHCPPAAECLYSNDDIDSVHHLCREFFYFIVLNILRSVGGYLIVPNLLVKLLGRRRIKLRIVPIFFHGMIMYGIPLYEATPMIVIVLGCSKLEERMVTASRRKCWEVKYISKRLFQNLKEKYQFAHTLTTVLRSPVNTLNHLITTFSRPINLGEITEMSIGQILCRCRQSYSLRTDTIKP